VILSQVYEDDLERNYHLILEILIAIKTTLPNGLPTVKDLQACLYKHVMEGSCSF